MPTWKKLLSVLVLGLIISVNTASARFLSVDPAAVNPDDPATFNRYSYANNNPYRFVDPDGNSPVDIIFFGIDAYNLGAAVTSGQGIGQAGIDLGISAIGLASPVPGMGLAIKAGRGVKGIGRGARGLETRGIRPQPGTRVKPDGIPDNWRIGSSKSRGGVKYTDPKNPHNNIRVEQGVPGHPNANSRSPHVRDVRNGRYVDGEAGRPVAGGRRDPAGHIPLDGYKYRP